MIEFTGQFKVLRPFMMHGRRVEPGETVQIADKWTARDLLDARRVECSAATLGKLIEATNRPPAAVPLDARAGPDGGMILPTKLAGLVRRVGQRYG